MARVFTITTTATNLRLDAQGRTETSFTVSNVSGRTLRGRAEVRATDSTQQGWFSVAGEPERELPAKSTHQITVRIAAPPGSPAGKFSFRLDMVSAQNPDEDFAEGPSMAFEVPAPAPKKPFPWWIVIVAAAVVLIIGGVTTYLMTRDTAPTTEANQSNDAPAAPLVRTLPVQYAPGWADYQDLHRDDPGKYAPFMISKAGDVCVVQGLSQAWGPAGIAGQPQVATLPEECRPQQQMIFNLNNNANTVRLDVGADGRMVWGAGGVESGWISLTGVVFAGGQSRPLDFGATWTNYGGPFAGGAVRKQGSVCVVEGLLKTTDPGGVAARPEIAILPPDCRPKNRVIFNLNNHARTARVDVLPDGRILWVVGGADHGWISLSGMVLATGEAKPLELGQTWVTYGPDFAAGTVRIDGGLCVVEGLVKTTDPGGIPAKPWIATLPPGCRPKGSLLFNLNNHGSTARVDVLPTGQVLWRAGGTAGPWISLNGLTLVSDSAEAAGAK